MRNILRLRVLAILLLALGLFGSAVTSASAQEDTDFGKDGTPTEAGSGSLAVSAFLSSQVSIPTITYFQATANADGGAEFTEADFALYLNGNFSAEPWYTFSTTNGDAVVIDNIPTGANHQLVYYPADGSNAYSWTIRIDRGQLTSVTLLIPDGTFSGNVSTGSVVVSSYAFQSSTDTTPRWWTAVVNTPNQGAVNANDLVSPPVDAKYSGAYLVDRQFTININGGGTGLNLQTDGGVALFDKLPPGVHTITDTQTGYSAEFEIVAGSITTVTVVFPEGYGDTGSSTGDKDTEDPDDGDTAGDTGSDSGSDTGNNGSNGGGKVSSLPSTGQGSNSSDSSTIVLILGAMSLVALAGGFAWRQRRTA
jgi:hypothetical protein